MADTDESGAEPGFWERFLADPFSEEHFAVEWAVFLGLLAIFSPALFRLGKRWLLGPQTPIVPKAEAELTVRVDDEGNRRQLKEVSAEIKGEIGAEVLGLKEHLGAQFAEIKKVLDSNSDTADLPDHIVAQFFEILGEDVKKNDLGERILDLAQKHVELRGQLAAKEEAAERAGDKAYARDFDQAQAAIDEGAYQKADEFLRQAQSNARQRKAEAEDEANRHLRQEGDAIAERARLAQLRLRHEDAASLFDQAAEMLLPVSDWQTLMLFDEAGEEWLIAGSTENAIVSFEASHELATALLTANKENAFSKRAVSFTLTKLGDVRLKLGETKEARRALEESLSLDRELLAKDPGSAVAQRDLSISLQKLGRLRLQLGETERARKAYEESQTLRKSLLGKDPASAVAQRDLSVSLNILGDIRLKLGDTEEAQQVIDESLVLRKALLAKDPGSAEAQRDLAVSYEKAGDCWKALNNLQEALKSYQACLDIFREANERDSNAHSRRDLSEGLRNVGLVLYGLEEPDRAQALFEDSLELLRALVEADSLNINFRIDHAKTLKALIELEESDAELDGGRYRASFLTEMKCLREKGVRHQDMEELEAFAAKLEASDQA